MTGSIFDKSGSWVMKIILANVVVYMLQIITQSSSMMYYFGLTPALVFTKYYVWQLCTYMFLHSPGSFLHIFLNMYALMLFGIPVEQLWGSKKFVFYYFFTGIGAGIVIFVINLFAGGMAALTPTIGASGAVFGLLLAFGILFPDVELLVFFFIPMKAKYLVVLYGAIEFFSLISAGANSNVSHIGHLGGLLFGLIFFLVSRKKGLQFSAKKIKAKMSKEIKKRDKILNLDNESSMEKLSLILEKLKKGGVDSISDDEYQFIRLSDILYSENNELCIQEDFDAKDDYCRKCENMESCLIREIKKFL